MADNLPTQLSYEQCQDVVSHVEAAIRDVLDELRRAHRGAAPVELVREVGWALYRASHQLLGDVAVAAEEDTQP